MAREQFRTTNFRPDTAAFIDVCNEIIKEYQEQGLRLTLRQLYYQCVARDLFPGSRTWIRDAAGKWVSDPDGTINADPNYKWLGSILADGRYAGMIDWDAIEDRGRQPDPLNQWNSIRSLVRGALQAFRLPRWEGQDCYVELWVEKEALAGVLEPLANEHHVVLSVNKGYSSASAMYAAAERFKAQDDGGDRRLVLLYLGDHDPSGEDMVRDIADRLHEFGADVGVKKIALNMDQVRQYRPPPNPAKMSDSRAKAYVAKFGTKSWEVDALPPDVLAALIRSAFLEVLDRDKYDAVIEREEMLKLKLVKAAERIED
jgi:hypothetical protein